ncbi:hypothetical protein EB796_002658 [Bugula neritina]|uniref:Major facilitator superfamily (MFS) profile domain-containing protein n=1 Tax=Bugula neritina TaxID=10212 RepID=A0A7J7KLF7_BUGNE|nr:hypothetical protein EB796_002658 [Bugula neritina]
MKLLHHQVIIFTLGWVAYASTYLLRKPIGVLKSDIQKELELSTTQLGWFDVSLLLPYAVAQMLLGSVGDSIGSRKTLSLCLICSGLSMISFGMWSHAGILCALLFLNGLSQSLCWPNCTKVLSSWFTEQQKNTVFGFFGTCAFAGGIIGTGLAVYFRSTFGSWRQVHFIPSIFVIAVGILCYIMYRESKEAGYNITEENSTTKIPSAEDVESDSPSQSTLSFRELAQLPGVAEISVAVFCLKLVRYCMYMWLPMYLEKQLSYPSSNAGLFSTMFEIGGVVGSAALGLILDKFSSQRPLYGVTLTVVASAVALIVFNLTSSFGYAANSIRAAIPNKIGQQDNRNSGSAVTGIVNGFGSLGTVLEGPVIAWVSNYYGWSSMFTMMVVLTIVGALATIKASISLDNGKS